MELISTQGFVPRWQCGLWPEYTGWSIIIADAVIFVSYMGIPLVLQYFAARFGLLKHAIVRWITALFVGFIFLCGVSHFLDAQMFWIPVYNLLAAERIATALFSLATLIALPYLCSHLKIEWSDKAG